MGTPTRRAVLKGTAAVAGLPGVASDTGQYQRAPPPGRQLILTAAGRRSGLGRREAQASADTTLREAAMTTSEDRTSGASGTAEQHVPGLERGELREATPRSAT